MAVLLSICRRDVERPSFERKPVGRKSTLRGRWTDPTHVMLQNLSRDGCRVDGALDLWRGMTVNLGLPGIGQRTAIVACSDRCHYGCTFDAPLSSDDLARAFDGGNEIHASIHVQVTPSFPAPLVRRWHPAIRTRVIVAATALHWATSARLLV